MGSVRPLELVRTHGTYRQYGTGGFHSVIPRTGRVTADAPPAVTTGTAPYARAMSVRVRRAHTKRALVSVARGLFARQGYAATSLDEIVSGAEVTKGALYHHFRGKQELYGAVLAVVEEDARQRIRACIEGVGDPWERALVGLREFLAIARGEEYRRIVILEGPAVLGYEAFRELEERSSYGLVQDIVTGLLEPYDLPTSQLAAFTRLFFGAISTTASSIALAPDPQQASDDAEGAVMLVLAGIRSLLGDPNDPGGPGD